MLLTRRSCACNNISRCRYSEGAWSQQ